MMFASAVVERLRANNVCDGIDNKAHITDNYVERSFFSLSILSLCHGKNNKMIVCRNSMGSIYFRPNFSFMPNNHEIWFIANGILTSCPVDVVDVTIETNTFRTISRNDDNWVIRLHLSRKQFDWVGCGRLQRSRLALTHSYFNQCIVWALFAIILIYGTHNLYRLGSNPVLEMFNIFFTHFLFSIFF